MKRNKQLLLCEAPNYVVTENRARSLALLLSRSLTDSNYLRILGFGGGDAVAQVSIGIGIDLRLDA